MTVQTLTLADFLLARIAEDREMAIGQAIGYPADTVNDGTRLVSIGVRYSLPPAAVRALADCEAKRRIVELRRSLEHPKVGLFGPGRADAATAETLVHVFMLMAAPYADHPDFREEWRT